MTNRFAIAVTSVGLALVMAGCFGDKSESIDAPGTLAVGAYGELLFGDVCPGSKADLCSRETVESVDSFTVDPPGALEVIPVGEVPADLLIAWVHTATYVVHGLAPGHANLCVQAKFSDGSHRKACQMVEVGAIARVATPFACDSPQDDDTAPGLVPPGRVLSLSVQMFTAGGTALGGVLLHPIDDAQLVPSGVMSYVWSSPPAGGSLTLGSSLDPAFSKTLATYGPDQVTGVVVHADVIPPTTLAPGRQQEIQVLDDVGPVRACQGLPSAIRTETPDVCAGPNGEIAWTGSAFTAREEGTCRLSVGVAGGAGYPGTVSVPFYFVNEADRGRDATIGSHCTVKGQRTCEATRDAILLCTGAGVWALTSSCNGLLCDYTAAAPCAAGAACVACR
ncbi:MAG TPA: hypothetical protein VGS03_13915 [Candidatus Polarisedimenticolia bacterium]|nr:hypothetical protein [Candidatus Polarisedimenticolia bacterium]